MMQEITKDHRDKMRYRRMVIKDKLKEIERLVTGRAESYLPLISGEDGRVSGEKTGQLVSEMLGAFRRYIDLDPRRTLREETLKMHESFLYCAVMSLGLERSRRDREVISWRISSVFEDIIRRAESVEIIGCGSYDRYLKDCYRAYRAACDMRDELLRRNERDPLLRNAVVDLGSTLPETDSDFFIGVKRSLEFLGYPPFAECLTDDALQKLRGDYEKNQPLPEIKTEEKNGKSSVISKDEDSDYLTKFLRKQEKNTRIDEEINSLREDETYADNKALSGFTPEEVRKREQDRANDELLAVKPDWQSRIVFDGETLLQNFQRFLQLYFENPDRRYFVEDIENMVDTFLYENGLSAFSLGDDYGMISFYIDRTKGHIEREVERGKRK